MTLNGVTTAVARYLCVSWASCPVRPTARSSQIIVFDKGCLSL